MTVFEQIRDSVSVIDYLKNKSLDVKQIGSGYQVSQCPFCGGHDCFRIFADGKRWSCFQCPDNKIGKDVIDLEYYFSNSDYSTAIKYFADTLGLIYEQEGLSLISLDIKNKALEYFQACLQDFGKTQQFKDFVFHKEPYSGTIWQYLTGLRKHSEECLIGAKIGVTDGLLVEYLKTQGYELKEIRASGLTKNDRDLFKSGLILYPHFVNGKISHFTCKDPTRKLDPYQLEVRFRDSGWRFYNQDCVLDTDVEDKTVVLVEGEDDLLSVVYKANVRTCIAHIGNLRDEQLKFLQGLQQRGWILLMGEDADEQGKKYRNTLLERVGGHIFNIPIGENGIPDGKDIDDILCSATEPADAFVEILKNVESDPKLYKVSSLSIPTQTTEKKENIPYSLEHEKFLLRNVIRGDNLVVIFEKIHDKDIFYKSLYKIIFTELRALYDKGLTINELISYTMLIDKKVLKDDEYAEIMLDIFSSDIESAIEILEKKYKRRKIIEFSNNAIKKSEDEKIEIDEVEDEVTDGFFKLFKEDTTRTVEINSSNILDIQLGNKEAFKLIGTQYEDINNVIVSGFDPGKLIIIAGRPGMGKSTFKTNLKKYWIENKIGVIDFSPQNGVKIEQCRLDSLFTGLSFKKLWRRRVGDQIDLECNKVHKLIVDKKYALFQSEELQRLDMAYIVRKTRQFQKERSDIKSWIVIVDLADKIKEFRSDKNQAFKIPASLDMMVQYGNRFNFSFVPIVQIGRGGEHEKKILKKKPTLADLKGSGGWEEGADLIFLLFREKYYDDSIVTDIMEVNLAKQRNGPSAVFQKLFNGENCLIEDFATGSNEELPPQD